MKKFKDSKFWQWFRWLLLALLIAAVFYVVIFVIDWSPRSRKLEVTPTVDPVISLLEGISENQAAINERLDALEATDEVKEEEVKPTSTPMPTPIPTNKAETAENNLINPELFDAGDQPAGDGVGKFDIGVNPGQIGIVFGVDLNWDGNSISGTGCEMVLLEEGWYENFSIVDGRYEIYDLPSSDPEGWIEVLATERVGEQHNHYGCPAEKQIPIWSPAE